MKGWRSRSLLLLSREDLAILPSSKALDPKTLALSRALRDLIFVKFCYHYYYQPHHFNTLNPKTRNLPDHSQRKLVGVVLAGHPLAATMWVPGIAWEVSVTCLVRSIWPVMLFCSYYCANYFRAVQCLLGSRT